LTWIGETLQCSWERLIEWSGREINFLWKLDEEYPAVAVKLVTELLTARSTVFEPTASPLFSSAPAEPPRAVPLALVGCMWPDSHIFDSAHGLERDYGSINESERMWLIGLLIRLDPSLSYKSFGFLRRLVLHRMVVWRNVGVRFSRSVQAYLERHLMEYDARIHCVPAAGDMRILAHGPTVTPGGIARAALDLDETPRQILTRLQKYELFGVVTPAIDGADIADFRPTPQDLVLLSHHADGEPPWILGECPALHIGAVARILNESIEDTLLRCQRYRTL